MPLLKIANTISYEDTPGTLYGSTPGFQTKLAEIHEKNPAKVLSLLIDLIEYFSENSSSPYGSIGTSILYLKRNFKESFIGAVDFVCMYKPIKENHSHKIFQDNWNKYYTLLQYVISDEERNDFLSFKASQQVEFLRLTDKRIQNIQKIADEIAPKLRNDLRENFFTNRKMER